MAGKTGLLEWQAQSLNDRSLIPQAPEARSPRSLPVRKTCSHLRAIWIAIESDEARTSERRALAPKFFGGRHYLTCLIAWRRSSPGACRWNFERRQTRRVHHTELVSRRFGRPQNSVRRARLALSIWSYKNRREFRFTALWRQLPHLPSR